MPRDGSGNYSLPESPFVSGNVIASAAVNSNNSDIAAALTGSVAKDGVTTPTANLPMGSFRHTGVAAASALTDYAQAGQVVAGSLLWCGTAGGTANAITITPTIAISAYAAGQRFRFIPALTNTGAVTVAVSGLAAKAVRIAAGPIMAGGLAPGKAYDITYDGTNFQIQNASPVVSILDFGATGDGTTNDAPAFEAALAASLAVYLPGNGRIYNIANTTAIGIRDYHSIFGDVGLAAAAVGLASGCPKLLMSGSSTNGFQNDDAGTKLLHASMTNLTIQFTGSYTRMFDMTEMLGCDFANMDVETTNTSMEGFRSRKLDPANFSWVNQFYNTRWRLPDASTGRPFDVDFSDSSITQNIFGGGKGAIFRGTGGMKILANLFNNTTAAGAGVTLSIETNSGSQHILANNQIEVNAGYDILVDGDADDTLAPNVIGLIIADNMIRSGTVTAAIRLENTTGAAILKQVSITGNTFNSPNDIVAISYDPARWTNVTKRNNTYYGRNYDLISVGYDTSGSELTIASGAVAAISSWHRIDTEGDASTDDLDTISGVQEGEIVIISPENSARDVTVKNGTGNLTLNAGDFPMKSTGAAMALMGTSSGLRELFRVGQQSVDFTPTAAFGTVGDSSFSYVTQTGKATLLANWLHFSLQLECTSNAYTTASGEFTVLGLPFSPSVTTSIVAGRLSNVSYGGTDEQIGAHVNTAGVIKFYRSISGAGGGTATTVHFPASTTFTLWLSGAFPIA